MKQATVTLTAILVALIAACSYPLEEQQRVASPTGKYEAVAAIRLTGATGATPSEVYIVKSGDKPAGEPVLRADHVAGLHVRWTGPQAATIHADSARIFLSRENVSVAGDLVTIKLDATEITE